MLNCLYFFIFFFRLLYVLFFFFFNDTATTQIYTLSLHDALPISTPPPRQAPLIAATVGNGSARMRPNSSCPARLPAIASSRELILGNSSISAPAQKTNGFPVRTIAAQSPDSSSETTRSADSNALRPSTVGFV